MCSTSRPAPSRTPPRRKHHSFVAFLIFLTALFAAPSAQAETPATKAAPQTAAPAPLSAQEAQQLLNVLNDPKQRDAFTHTLSLMARGIKETPSAIAPASDKKALPEVSPEIGNGLNSVRTQFMGYVHNFLSLFKYLGLVGHWLHTQLASAETRAPILHAFGIAFIVIACGLALERVVALMLRNPLQETTRKAQAQEARNARHPIETDAEIAATTATSSSSQTRAEDQRRQVETLRFLARIPYSLAHLLLKAVPVLAFLLLTVPSIWVLPISDRTANVILTLAYCYAGARGLYLLVETAFTPRSPTIRLLPASDPTAFMVTRWWNVLVAAPAIVICLSELGAQFNLAPRGTDAMIRGVVLVEHVLIAAFIWRVRHIVSRALQPNTMGKKTGLWTVIAAITRLWWVPAMFLDISLWIVWAAHLQGGYAWILKTTGATIAVLVASRLGAVLAYGLQDRFFRVNPQLEERFPELQKRADRYYPAARAILTGTILFLTLIAITEAWGLPTFGFFIKNALGRRLMDTVMTMLIAVTVAAAIWEVVNIVLNRQLTSFENSGQRSRATRLQTVLPIIRTVLLAIIIIIVAVTTLSQIGINVTPLLTGAGILGAAIAFGSQSLVKDFITGFFMLVEDAIQVGDWVTTGGVSGTVENLSIRTVKVRDITGDLHIIPFSSVSSIANTARGYNQIVIKQQLDLSEDLPRVSAIMSKAVKEMRADPVFGPMVLSDYTDLGVDQSDSGGATLIGSIRTTPMMKWKVKREFNRIVTNRFAEEGVKFYTPTAYTTTPPGNAMQFHVANDTAPQPAPEAP